MKKLTKKILNKHGMHNPCNVCVEGGGKVCIDYIAWDSVSRNSSGWKVWGNGFKTDPDAHWQEYGSKKFLVMRGGPSSEDGKAKLEETKRWASRRYGITEWEKDPFGGWQDKRVMDRIREMINGKSDATGM